MGCGVFAASHFCARSASRQSTKQAPRLCFVRDLWRVVAEHRGATHRRRAAGKFCCVKWHFRKKIYAIIGHFQSLTLVCARHSGRLVSVDLHSEYYRQRYVFVRTPVSGCYHYN